MSKFDPVAEAVKFEATAFLGSAAEWRENLKREFVRIYEAGRRDERAGDPGGAAGTARVGVREPQWAPWVVDGAPIWYRPVDLPALPSYSGFINGKPRLVGGTWCVGLRGMEGAYSDRDTVPAADLNHLAARELHDPVDPGHGNSGTGTLAPGEAPKGPFPPRAGDVWKNANGLEFEFTGEATSDVGGLFKIKNGGWWYTSGFTDGQLTFVRAASPPIREPGLRGSLVSVDDKPPVTDEQQSCGGCGGRSAAWEGWRRPDAGQCWWTWDAANQGWLFSCKDDEDAREPAGDPPTSEGSK